MRVSLKPLTPLWTGNNDGRSDILRETGILGGLRWWFEGMVRAMGYYACDPVDHGCLYTKKEDNICAACRLFGCTGWARRFRLRAAGLHAEPWYVVAAPEVARLHRSWLTRVYKPDSQVLWGDCLTLDFERHLTGVDWNETQALLAGLVWTVSQLGGLGAKTQNGFGGVKLKPEWIQRDAPDPPVAAPASWMEAVDSWRARGWLAEGANQAAWFDLCRTLFLRFALPNAGTYANNGGIPIPGPVKTTYSDRVIPAAYDVRYKYKAGPVGAGQDEGLKPGLKSWLREDGVDRSDIEALLGSSAQCDEERSASRVFVQHLCRELPSGPYQMKLWAHVPADSDIEMPALQAHIETLVRKQFRGCSAVSRTWAQLEAEL